VKVRFIDQVPGPEGRFAIHHEDFSSVLRGYLFHRAARGGNLHTILVCFPEVFTIRRGSYEIETFRRYRCELVFRNGIYTDHKGSLLMSAPSAEEDEKNQDERVPQLRSQK